MATITKGTFVSDVSINLSGLAVSLAAESYIACSSNF